MTQLRIFSYLPNPRIWKATIAARLCGVAVEVRGAAPEVLVDWLWDFDARPLDDAQREQLADLQRGARTGFSTRLFKTDAFLQMHPFGTVPAAFSPDGKIGIFESNSIMRTVARLGQAQMPLYGLDPYQASRIDSFLDSSLVFARDAQLYILALRTGLVPTDLHARAEQAFATFLGGIERALKITGDCIVDGGLSLADIAFVAEFALFHNEALHTELLRANRLAPILSARTFVDFPAVTAHFARLRQHPAFAPDTEAFLDAIPDPRLLELSA